MHIKVILFITATITLCFFSCSTKETSPQVQNASIIDSLQTTTIQSDPIKSSQEEIESDTILEDGWYTIDHNNTGIQKIFYNIELLNLQQKPFIPLTNIDAIQSELSIDGIDTFRIITFSFNKNAEAAWKKMISDPTNAHIYFALDNELVNIFKVFTNSENTRAYNLDLTLPYGDFTPQETLDIEKRIKQRLLK